MPTQLRLSSSTTAGLRSRRPLSSWSAKPADLSPAARIGTIPMNCSSVNGLRFVISRFVEGEIESVPHVAPPPPRDPSERIATLDEAAVLLRHEGRAALAELRAPISAQTATEPLRRSADKLQARNETELAPNSLGGLVELSGIEPLTSSLRSTKSGFGISRLEGQTSANPGTEDQRLSDPCGQIAGNGSGVPITPDTRWRLLLALSRDAALEPLDARVAIELIDKLAAGTRTRLDIDTLATNVSASPVGVYNALERLRASGYIAIGGSWGGYAGASYALVLGARAIAGSTDGG
jgi:hypothetical protein